MMTKEFDALEFNDDFMFCKVLQTHPEVCRLFVELFTGRKIKEINCMEPQKTVQITSNGKGVRFDVYFEDEEGVLYDIEMQNADSGYLEKRTRYYQAMLDLNTLEKGDSYKRLRKTYIIFLCMFDPFKKSRCKYTIQKMCKEDLSIKVIDDAKTIFINPMGLKDDLSDDEKHLMSYLRKEAIAQNSISRMLNDAVNDVKQHVEWRMDYMKYEADMMDIRDDTKFELYYDLIKEGIITKEYVLEKLDGLSEAFQIWIEHHESEQKE